jgi:prepilin-type N-terminal cleavage/methylation domain-containing protein
MKKIKESKPKKSKRAFTLMELLVVIAIIALLLAILLPTLTKIKGLARAIICKNNMRQIGVATVTYTSENDNCYPQSLAGGHQGYNIGNWPGNTSDLSGMTVNQQRMYIFRYASWIGLLSPHLDVEWNALDENQMMRDLSVGTVTHCPSHGRGQSEGGKDNFSYCGNSQIYRPWKESASAGNRRDNSAPVKGEDAMPLKFSSIIAPGSKIMTWELFHNMDEPQLFEVAGWRGGVHPEYAGQQGVEHQWFDELGWEPTHGKKLHYGFADGTVRDYDHMMKLLDSRYFDPRKPQGKFDEDD